MARLIVRIKNSHEPLLIGSNAYITSHDYVPWCEASRQNPMVDLVVCETGYKTTGFLSDVELVRKEP